MAPLEERWLAREGRRRVRWLIGGEGPPLLLCHGFLGSAENFDTWFAALCRRRTVVVPDLAGFGASAPLPGRHTADGLANDVAALLADLGWERFDLGGLCLGCSVALALLRRLPQRVDRLLLHTPLLAPEVVRRRFRLQARVLTAPGIFPTVTWLARRRVVSDLYKRLVVEGPNVDPRAAEVNFRNQRRACPRAAREWLHDGLGRDDTAVLAAYPGPTLVLVPADDRIVDARRLGALVAGWPRVTVRLLRDAGHGWTEDAVRRQLEVVTAFLDGRPLPTDLAA